MGGDATIEGIGGAISHEGSGYAWPKNDGCTREGRGY